MKNQILKTHTQKRKNFHLFKFVFLVFSFWFLVFGAKGANAAYFSLEPKTQTSSTGAAFDVKLEINTEGEQTTSADVVLLFDKDVLEVTGVTPADFYPQNFKNIAEGKVYIGGAVESPTEYKSGEDTLATITFKGKTEGTTVVRFDCTPGKTSDSNISKNDDTATDILDCTKLVNGTYTVGGDGDTTPRPTFAPTCSPSPSGDLPEAGVTLPSVFLLGIGGLLTVMGFLFTL